MKLPDEVRLWLTRRYASQHRQWLAADDSQSWPLIIPLGLPTETAALRQPDAVRAWVNSWRNWRGPGELEWVERRWKILGNQQLPQTLAIADAAQAAAWAGELERWQRAIARRARLLESWPDAAALLPRLFDTLADYADADFQRLMDLLAWLMAHPDSGLYPRQLPLAGMDSKWLEPRIGVVATILAALRGEAGVADPYALCGLRRLPATIRLRVLDPALRAEVGGLEDICAPVDTLAQLSWQPATILIVENLQTGLALADLPGTVAIMGLGYAVDVLARLPWARQANGLYWGDIDSHGYAILHRASSALPGLTSVMMDNATLQRYRALWSRESAQSSAEALPSLTTEEHAVYDALRSNTFGQGVRLEQERIDWRYAWTVVSEAVLNVEMKQDG